MSKIVYVTVTDKFMSGWGHAKNRISKMVVSCTPKQANEIHDNMLNDSNLKHVNMAFNKPYYNEATHHTAHKTYEEMTAYHNK